MNISTPWDAEVAIIGAGVVGCATARALALHGVASIHLLEWRPYPLGGASKGNSAMIHSGFDAEPGSVESTMVKRGHALFSKFATRYVGDDLRPPRLTDREFPFKKMGAVMVAFTEAEREAIHKTVKPKADANGVKTRLLSREEVLHMEPALDGQRVLCGLLVPDEWCVDPCEVPAIALQEALLTKRVELQLKTRVTRAKPLNGQTGWELAVAGQTQTRRYKWVINAAGLQGDRVEQCAGRPKNFEMFPRLGRFVGYPVPAADSAPVVGRMILPIPTAKTKGMIVFPTVHGHVVVGPTAEDPDDTRQPQPIIQKQLHAVGSRKVPSLGVTQPSWDFSGSRPAIVGRKDYFLSFDEANNWITLAGVRSTGLTSSMALGEWVVNNLVRVEGKMPNGLKPLSSIPNTPKVVDAVKRGEHLALFPRPFRHPISVEPRALALKSKL